MSLVELTSAGAPRALAGASPLVPAGAPTASPRRLLCWSIVGLFALTAVGWRSPAYTPLGVARYFHLPMLLVPLLAVGREALLRRIAGLVGITALFSGVLVAFEAYHGLSPTAFQQAVYLGAAFMVAASLRRLTVEEWRIVRWAGPCSILFFVVPFWLDARAIGMKTALAK